MLQLTRRYLRQIDGIFLALCAACSALSVVTLVSIGHNQLGSINKASVQFIASALGILCYNAAFVSAGYFLGHALI